MQVIAAADDEVGAFLLERQLELLGAVAVVLAVAELDGLLEERADARQVDLRDAQQVPLQQAELHQVDAVDLDLGRGDVAELQLHLAPARRAERW